MITGILTRVIRGGLKLFCPVLVDLDRGGVVLRILRTEPLVVGVLDESCEVVRVRGVHHVEEELAVGQVGLGALLGKELAELLLLHDIAYEVDHAQLIVLRDLDGAQLCPGDEMLPAREDLLQKVLGHLLRGRHVELAYQGIKTLSYSLTMLGQVVIEVALAAKSGNQVARIHALQLLGLLPLGPRRPHLVHRGVSLLHS